MTTGGEAAGGSEVQKDDVSSREKFGSYRFTVVSKAMGAEEATWGKCVEGMGRDTVLPLVR